jgi:predicted nucleic acid-binding protein
MMTPPITCVVDASVGIKVVMAEADSALAHALFEHLDRDPGARFYVPDLFLTECANALRTLAKRGLISHTDAVAKLADLQARRLQTLASDTLVNDTLTLALAHDLSVYDAIYVAAAADRGIPLITADDKLVRKLTGTGHAVLPLNSLSIPAPPP